MTNKQHNIYIAIMIFLNGICFTVTLIKERVVYSSLNINSAKNIIKWNDILSLIWKYSEKTIIIIVICVVSFYWVKRNKLTIFLELKISLGLFSSIFLVEILLAKLFYLPIGNIVQPLLWLVYIPNMLLILFIMKKLKKT